MAHITGFLHLSISVNWSWYQATLLNNIMDFLAMSSSPYTTPASWVKSLRSMPDVNILPAAL